MDAGRNVASLLPPGRIVGVHSQLHALDVSSRVPVHYVFLLAYDIRDLTERILTAHSDRCRPARPPMSFLHSMYVRSLYHPRALR